MDDPYIDVHCHLFNKDILSKWLRILIAAASLEDCVREAGAPDLAAEMRLNLDFLKRLKHFLSIGIKDDSIAIYEEMRRTYGDAYVSTPLMLDVAYISTPEEYQDIIERFMETDWLPSFMNLQRHRLEGKAAEVIGDSPGRMNALDEALYEAREALAGFHKAGKALDRGMAIPVFDREKSFMAQMEQLTSLKEKYSEFVFPFLSVDPRRPDIIETVKNHVGNDNTFLGVKLYPPIGFSPTDPVLMGNGGLYAYCQENRIPITAHCSCGGFATYANRATVTGHIYDLDEDSGKRKIREADHETIEFQNPFLPHVGAAIEERAVLLNHPKIWELVVEKYPGLHLNLAHLGGKSGEWRNAILDMMKPENNLYSDLACHADPDIVRSIKTAIFDGHRVPAMDRIIYGSDYYILMLFADELAGYEKSFRDIFGGDFGKLSVVNPGRFLFLLPENDAIYRSGKQ